MNGKLVLQEWGGLRMGGEEVRIYDKVSSNKERTHLTQKINQLNQSERYIIFTFLEHFYFFIYVLQ